MEKVTIYDIAKKLEVSPASVTRALNGLPKVGAKKRELIINTAMEMGYTPNRAATSLSRKQICVEAVVYGAITEFYQDIINGINAAYEELKDFNFKVNLHILDKGTDSEKSLCELLDSFRSSKTGAVLIYSVIDTPNVATGLDRLISDGVPVMVINSPISTTQPHYSVYPNGEMAGRMAAEILDWGTREKNICFFMGDPDTGILRHNNFGFLKEAEERGLSIVGKFYDYGVAHRAINYFGEFIESVSCKIDGIYINSAVSNSICKGFYEKGLLKNHNIIASDLGKDIIHYINQGFMPATIFQNPFKQGFEGLSGLYAITSGYKDIEGTRLVNPTIICKSNVQYYSAFASEKQLGG